MKKKIAILIMVDGAVIGEKYLEYRNQNEEDWSLGEESSIDSAQHFFY